MRFIHIADVHLGAQPDVGAAYSEVRPRELWDTFSAVIRVCEEEQTDLLLIAGDLFHRQPLLRELKEVDYLFSTLSKTKVVLIAGNHDYIRRDSHYPSFTWSSNVYPLFGRKPEWIHFPDLDAAVCGFSYYEREIREPLYDRIRAEDGARYQILLAHGGDETHIPVRRAALAGSGFDYIAMGHIHRPGEVIPHRAVYAGALEPIDKNDTGRHGFIRGELTKRGVHTEFVPFAKREYVHLVLKMDESQTAGSVSAQIRQAVMERGQEHFYKIILRGQRDPDILFDPGQMRVPDNVLELIDETEPAWDIERLWRENQENLIGKFISRFPRQLSGISEDGPRKTEDQAEEMALREGLRALLQNRIDEGQVW
jgi:DNA repair exonuclease SbcCD nuclease subunit